MFQKELIMVKKQIEEAKAELNEEVNGNVAAPLVNEGVGFVLPKDKAFSVVFDPKTNKWLAVEVLFDYQTGTLGGVRVLEQNPSKQIISERFHVLVGQNLL